MDDRDHVQRNIIEPQELAAKLRADGVPVEDVVVRRGESAGGFTVTCGGCGATGKMPFDPGPKLALCPRCIRQAQEEAGRAAPPV